jgi:uncharacterized protein YwgA
MSNIKYINSQLSDFVDLRDNTDDLRKKLLLFIYCISPIRLKNKTSIQKLNFFAQFEGLLPFIPKTLNHFGAYSSDIEYLLNDLINAGWLKEESHKVHHLTDIFTNERDFTVYKIPYDVQKNINRWAKKYDMDLDDYRREMDEFCKKHEKNTKFLGEKSKRKFLETIKTPDNYLFFDKTIIDEKLKEKLAFNGIDVIGIENFIKLPIALISKKIRTPSEIVEGIATEIISNKEKLNSFHFNIRSIHGNFYNKYGKINKNLMYSPVFLVGHFKKCSTSDKGYIAKFCDSTVKPKKHEIDVIIGKNGKFCQNRSIEDIKTNECIIIGKLDEIAGKPIIIVIGLIKIDSLPTAYIWEGKDYL